MTTALNAENPAVSPVASVPGQPVPQQAARGTIFSRAVAVLPGYVIEMDSVGGPCWVATGGGDPERTHLIECAEIYATEHEARESAAAFRSKYQNRKFFVRVFQSTPANFNKSD